jgi:ribose-phosphate pyrophosphokinase
VHKARLGPREVAAEQVVGDVRGRRPVIVDDIISTGGTITAALTALLAAGAIPDAVVAATHGVFAAGSDEALAAPAIRAVIVSDSVEPVSAPAKARLQRIPLGPLLSDAIGRLKDGRSLDDLLAKT